MLSVADWVSDIWKILKILLCISINDFILNPSNEIFISVYEGNMADDVMSLIYLTTMIITMMFLSSIAKSSAPSASTIPSYIWCISLPSLSLWIGWLSLALIFDQLYLQIKGI